MLTYKRLADAARARRLDLADSDDYRQVVDYLCDEWIDDYRRFWDGKLSQLAEFVEAAKD